MRSTADQVDRRTSRRVITAGSVGNFIEWYDFAAYGYLATVLGTVFFPSDNEVVSLLNSLGVFAVAFFFRPLGALLFGFMGDESGRKPTLVVIMWSMAISTTLIGLLPGYNDLGILSPVLLVILRAAQGLSAGGEFGGAVALMVEYAPTHRRGWYSSWQSFSVGLGLLGGSGVATLLTTLLTDEEMLSWGWRIPFLSGALLGPIAIYLRQKVTETPTFVEAKKRSDSRLLVGTETAPGHLRHIAHSIGTILGWSCAGYVFLIVMPSYLSTQLGMAEEKSLLATFVANAAFTAFIPLFGLLSDRFGRRSIMLIGAIGILVASYPLFLLLGLPGMASKMIALVIAGALVAAFAGPGPAMMSEMFSTERRFSGLSLGYSLSVAAFGGTAPFIVTWLSEATGDARAAAYYTIGGAAISVIALLKVKSNSHLTPLK